MVSHIPTQPTLLYCANCLRAMGNKIAGTEKKKKLSSAEMRKKKKERMARRKRGEEVFSDEDD